VDTSSSWFERFEAARTSLEVGEVLVGWARRLLGISNGNLFPLAWSHTLGLDDVYIWGEGMDRADIAKMWERYVELSSWQERELLPARQLFGRHTGVVEVNRRLAGCHLKRTIVYNDFWRPFHIERQLVMTIGSREAPLALSGLCRSMAEPAFSEQDVCLARQLARAAEKALRTLLVLGPVNRQLTDVLLALEWGFPAPSILFDSRGRLRWMNREAVLRFDVSTGRLHDNLVVARLPRPLQLLRRLAREAQRRPENAFFPPSPRPEFISPRERLLIRCWRGDRAEWRGVLLVLEPVRRAETAPVEVDNNHWGLTPREREVARLAARGNTIREVAVELNISSGTVHTHLKHVYEKLNVRNRPDLIAKLLHQMV